MLLENKKEIIAIEVRKNASSLPPMPFFEAIKKISNNAKHCEVYLAIPGTPTSKIISVLKKYGIGIITLDEGKISFLLKSKEFSKKKTANDVKHKQKSQIFVYPSSRQRKNSEVTSKTLEERKRIYQIVKDFRETNLIPIFTKEIETDSSGGTKFREKMKKGVEESHIFIGVIKNPYSKQVEFEFKLAIERKRRLQILILRYEGKLQSELEEKESIHRQTKLVKRVENNGVVHLPYHNLNQFEIILRRNLMQIINKLYRKQNLPSPFDK